MVDRSAAEGERAPDVPESWSPIGRLLARWSFWIGIAVALVGGAHLAAWITGFMAQRGLSSITMKTNAALCLLLLGASVALIARDDAGPVRRWLTRACTALSLVISGLTLLENAAGWDFGIDQLLSVEPPGALGVVSPNRMGTPASIGMTLAGAVILMLTAKRRLSVHLAQAFAIGVFAIGLLSTMGYLYGARTLFGVARLTAIAWPTAICLAALAVGLLCVKPTEGLMAQLTSSDPGGSNTRRLLWPAVLLPVIAGWLRLAGERLGWFDAALGTALMMVLFIVSFSTLAYVGGRRVSRAANAVLAADGRREELLLQVGDERQRLRAVLEQLPAGVLIVHGHSGRIVFANAYAERILGAASGVDANAYAERWKPHHEGGTPFTPEEMVTPRALRGETVISEEMLVTGEDARSRTLSVSAAPLRNASGEVTGAVVTFEEVTERRRVEQALGRSESELQTIVENVDQGIVVADMNGQLLHWNRAALAMHGLASLEEGQRPLSGLTELFELSEMAGAVVPYEEWPLMRILRGNRLRDCELRIKRRGTDWERVFSYGGTLVRDEKGQGLQAVVTVTDVTVRKRAELALQAAKLSAERAKVAAEEATRAKDQFIAVLSHELRTPLAPVLTGIALLEREIDLSERGRHVIDLVRRNVEMESRLIDDLLDVTGIVRGKVSLDKRRVALCTVIERTIEVCRPEIEAKQLQFGVDLGPRPYVLDGDAARLQQVFWNLVKNAVKFTPAGGRVGLRCRPEDDHVVVDVHDSGVGFNPAQAGAVFDAFMQAGRSTAGQFGGLGLGLTISRALVEMHGGTIQARSGGAGKGATFTVRLPIVAYGYAAAQAVEPADRRRDARPTSRLRVLLVEDHADTVETMVAMLQLAGHEVRAAGDVAAALHALAEERFDLLISDLGLPDRDGLDLIRSIRSRGETLPAIALSGYGQETDVQQSRLAGFNSHLVKPVEPRRLLETIETLTTSP